MSLRERSEQKRPITVPHRRYSCSAGLYGLPTPLLRKLPQRALFMRGDRGDDVAFVRVRSRFDSRRGHAQKAGKSEEFRTFAQGCDVCSMAVIASRQRQSVRAWSAPDRLFTVRGRSRGRPEEGVGMLRRLVGSHGFAVRKLLLLSGVILGLLAPSAASATITQVFGSVTCTTQPLARLKASAGVATPRTRRYRPGTARRSTSPSPSRPRTGRTTTIQSSASTTGGAVPRSPRRARPRNGGWRKVTPSSASPTGAGAARAVVPPNPRTRSRKHRAKKDTSTSWPGPTKCATLSTCSACSQTKV